MRPYDDLTDMLEASDVLYGDLGPHGSDLIADQRYGGHYTVRLLTEEPVAFSSGLRRDPVISHLLVGTAILTADDRLVLDVDINCDPIPFAEADLLLREQFLGACERSSVEATIDKIFKTPSF